MTVRRLGDRTVPTSILAIKTADTARTSATPSADPHLSLALTAGTWQVTVNLAITSATASISWQLTYSGSLLRGVLTGSSTPKAGTATTARFYTMTGGSIGVTTWAVDAPTSSADVVGARVEATLVAFNGGTLAISWGSTAATLMEGSAVTALKVA